MFSRFFFRWSVPSMTNDEDMLFPTSFLEGFMGQLVIWDKLCVACILEMIQTIKFQKH
jgi:hypothetical protein